MVEAKPSITLRIGWLLLLLMAVLMILGGLESLGLAYWGQDVIAGVSLDELSKVNGGLPNALRGRRATAASFAITCGLLTGWIALTAFRRREKWAWYALLCSLGLGAVLSMFRYLALGMTAGVTPAVSILVVLLLALAVSWRDFR